MKTLKQALEEAGFGLKDLERMQADLSSKKPQNVPTAIPEIPEDYTDMAEMFKESES